MKSLRLSRRALLRGAGGISLALPALDAMRPARAAGSTAPKRLVVFYTPNGTNADVLAGNAADFWPAQVGASFTLGKEVAPLEPLRKQLLVVSGVDGVSTQADDSYMNPDPTVVNHGDLHSIGMSQMLTGVSYLFDAKTGLIPGALPGGYAGGISVDQYVAKKVGAATRFPSLEFGVMNTTDHGVLPFSRMISAGPNQPIPAEQDPAAMFKRIFGNGTPAAATSIDHALVQRASILDFVQGDFARLEPRLGVSDRQKLDAHLSQVRELETRLQKPVVGPTASCDTSHGLASAGDPLDVVNFPATGKNHMDLLVLALKCDVTRVASLQWSWARSNIVHAWAGASQGHHDMSHFGSTPQLTAVNNWYAQQLAYLGQALLATPDVDGKSVLDNTVIYWASEVGWAYTHSFKNLRAFLLGSCGGALKTGVHLDVGGVPHQGLLVTLLKAMGLTDNQFGNPKYGTGPLPGVLA